MFQAGLGRSFQNFIRENRARSIAFSGHAPPQRGMACITHRHGKVAHTSSLVLQ